jgi:hypothetical protein
MFCSNTLYIFWTLTVRDVQQVNRLNSSATSERIFVRSSGGSTRHRRTEQDIVNEKMKRQLRENKEYNL